MRLLILPDIHGRDFWHVAEKEIDNFSKIIFLGDYHDPYPFENIDTDTSLQNFMEILSFAKTNRDKVVLLCGNHDLSYIDGMSVDANRYDEEHEDELWQLFRENDDLFQLAYAVESDEENVLFTHAGVLGSWHNHRMNGIEASATAIANELNTWFAEKTHQESLRDIGWIRGGEDIGSCVWADVIEFEQEPYEFPFYQVFGHTMQKGTARSGKIITLPPIITDNYACIDTSEPYVLDSGTVCKFAY